LAGCLLWPSLPSTRAQWTELWNPKDNTGVGARSAHAAVVFNDSMYVFGGVRDIAGDGDGTELQDTWKFDLVSHQWTVVVDPTEQAPPPRYHHGGALHTNASITELVVFGGISVSKQAGLNSDTNVTQYNDVWRLELHVAGTDKPTRGWTSDNISSSSLPMIRSEAPAVVYGDQLIIFERRWLQVEMSVELTRAYTSLVVRGQTLCFFGGFDRPSRSPNGYVLDDVVIGNITIKQARGNTTASLEVVQLSMDDTTTAPDARYDHRAALWGNNMVISGGAVDVDFADVWAFDIQAANANVSRLVASQDTDEIIIYVVAGVMALLLLLMVVGCVRWRLYDRRVVSDASISYRCSCQCQRYSVTVNPLQLERAAQRGLEVIRGVSQERMAQLEIAKYKKPASTGDDPANDDPCPICLVSRMLRQAVGMQHVHCYWVFQVEFEENEDVRKLPCKHIFHVPCVDEWLSKSTACPMCKGNVDGQGQSVPATNGTAPAPVAGAAVASSGPGSRGVFAMAAAGDLMVVHGGLDFDGDGEVSEYDDTWVFDLSHRQWTQVGLNKAMRPLTEFVIFGGISLSPSNGNSNNSDGIALYNDVWRLRVPSNRTHQHEFVWSKDKVDDDAIIPTARHEAPAVIYNQRMYIFGGISMNEEDAETYENNNDIWCYDLVASSWSKIEPTHGDRPTGRFAHAMALYEHDGSAFLVVVGGLRTQGSKWDLLEDVWLFSLDERIWVPVQTTNMLGRAYSPIVVVDSSVWFFGGYFRSGGEDYVSDIAGMGKIDVQKRSDSGASKWTASITFYGELMRSRKATPSMRLAHQIVRWGTSMVIYGGTVDHDYVCSKRAAAQWTELWDPDTSSSGTNDSGGQAAASQPPARSAFGVAAVDDRMFVFGGLADGDDDEHNELQDTWMFNLTQRNWTKVVNDSALAPSHRFHHSAVMHVNESMSEFVIFGGLSITSDSSTSRVSDNLNISQYNDVWRLRVPPNGTVAQDYAWTKDALQKDATAPSVRSEAAAVLYNQRMYIFGGISYDDLGVQPPTNHNDLWSYDLVTGTWTEIVPVTDDRPTSRFSHSMTLFQDDKNASLLVVFSGRHLEKSTWNLIDDVWLFSLDELVWVQAARSAPVQRAYTSIVVVNSTMWFFGGYYRPNKGTNGYVYDDVIAAKISVDNSSADSGSNISDWKASMKFYHSVARSKERSPALRYNHRAFLWGSSMVIYGGSYEVQRGDVWAYNTTGAVLAEEVADVLPYNVETLIYVLGGFIVSIMMMLFCLLVRWRRIDRRNLELARRRGVAVMRGVSKERMLQLEITKYKKPQRDVEEESKGSSGDDVCPICLIDFEDDEDVRKLPCKHIFHVPCVDEWLKRNTSCPMCKGNVDLSTDHITLEPIDQPRGGAIITPLEEPPRHAISAATGTDA
ncbi:TPA: hypothetical protein N0F65_004422, partial [Lagenidium giganteum]